MSLTNNANLGLTIDNARITGNTPLYNVTGTLGIDAEYALHADLHAVRSGSPSRSA